MALISSFTARRLADRKPPATRQIITFNAGSEWLAISTEIAQKVVPIQAIYKDQESLYLPTIYESKEVYLLDPITHLVGAKKQQELDTKKGYLILLEASQKKLIAILLSAAPVLRRTTETAFIPIALIRPIPKNMETISRFAIQVEDEPLIFLLDYNHLIQIAIQ
jgi:chemotaxis signal transduction protein